MTLPKLLVADAGELHPAVVPVDQTSHQLLALSPNNLTHSEDAGAPPHRPPHVFVEDTKMPKIEVCLICPAF